MVALLEKDVTGRHPPGAVLSGVDGDVLVGVLGHLVEIGREDPHLGAVVPRLGGEVAVRRAGHVEVGPHHRQELGVVPVRRLVNVGLLTPDLGRRRRQIGIPVVKR